MLYYDCPVDYTAQCGFDVLAHASEPYVSRLNFQPSLGNALHAIKLTSENLREATWNGQDLKGREGMMYAQYIAAQAFNSGGLGIIHSISHAMSARSTTPTTGSTTPSRCRGSGRSTCRPQYKRFADIARAMGIDTHGMTDVQAAEAALGAAIRLLRDVGITERFIDVTQDTLLARTGWARARRKFYENAGDDRRRQGRRGPDHQPRPR